MSGWTFSVERYRGRDDLLLEIELCRLRLTLEMCRIRAAVGRPRREDEMSRLSDKLKKASAIAGRVTATIEARADALIAREAELDSRTEKAFAPHEDLLDDHERDLDQVEAALRLLSNSDPFGASEHSHDSPRSSELAVKTS